MAFRKVTGMILIEDVGVSSPSAEYHHYCPGYVRPKRLLTCGNAC
jgi:hypothetical protein